MHRYCIIGQWFNLNVSKEYYFGTDNAHITSSNNFILY